MPELTFMVGQLKEKIFQLSSITQELIKLSNEDEESPMQDTIERMKNNAFKSSEEMDKTLSDIEK